ncbi:unnamed protein product [Musa acuminata subsp. malaccensis]|uniref:(wild Malaysian banana) hypothetical protein n=1 Tax=Musa acuminata subsp. malaccensis TaxID=214687 RepID=A0A804KGB0_MUSAM|nr:unnamed protein product [Musa acuminata subsp. malaccensis]
MEGSRGSSNSPSPFLTKTYEMVDDLSTNSIVSWSPINAGFVVWKQLELLGICSPSISSTIISPASSGCSILKVSERLTLIGGSLQMTISNEDKSIY